MRAHSLVKASGPSKIQLKSGKQPRTSGPPYDGVKDAGPAGRETESMDISTIRPIAEATDSVCCIVRPGDRLESFTGTYHLLGGLLSGADSYIPPLPVVSSATSVTALLPDHDPMEAISTALWLATELFRPVTLLVTTDAGAVAFGPEIVMGDSRLEETV